MAAHKEANTLQRRVRDCCGALWCDDHLVHTTFFAWQSRMASQEWFDPRLIAYGRYSITTELLSPDEHVAAAKLLSEIARFKSVKRYTYKHLRHGSRSPAAEIQRTYGASDVLKLAQGFLKGERFVIRRSGVGIHAFCSDTGTTSCIGASGELEVEGPRDSRDVEPLCTAGLLALNPTLLQYIASFAGELRPRPKQHARRGCDSDSADPLGSGGGATPTGTPPAKRVRSGDGGSGIL